MSKIIKAVFTGRFCKTQRVFQFDTDDKLQIVNVNLPANYTVDFSNSKTGDSVPVLATSDTVQIPPDLFVPGSEIYAWIWLSDSNGGHTRCEATIPIDPRARRTGTKPTPAQASTWDEAVDTLNETIEGIPAVVDAALTEAKESGEFDGADGSGIWYTTERISSSENPFVRRRNLIGREGATVQVHDLLFAPDVGDEGEPTTLYEIVSVGTACELNRLCKMKGGGGSGTGDYNALDNKPQIAGVTLSGDKSLSDLGVAPKPMLVTLSYTGSGDTYTADKTYAEITDAIAAGREVLVDWGSSILRPSALGATWIGYDDRQTLEFILHSDSSWTGIITDLDSYRTSADQDVIDRQQNAAIEAKYTKPGTGVPKTDLAAAVQTSLGRADTALQQHQDISGKADKVTEVTVSTAGDVTQALDAGKIYHFTGALTSLTITLNAAGSGQLAQYHFDFDCGSTAPTVTIPNSVTMPSGNFEASKHYEVDILNNYGMVMAWETS